MQLQTMLLLPALVIATTTTTLTQTRSCSDIVVSGSNSASASLQSGNGSVTIPSGCSTTQCASAGAAIPTCAQSCMNSLASERGCSSGDAICTCNNMLYIQPAATSCIAKACPSSQYVPLTASVQALCSCASALASDLSCIATASAGAGSRTRTRTKTTKKTSTSASGSTYSPNSSPSRSPKRSPTPSPTPTPASSSQSTGTSSTSTKSSRGTSSSQTSISSTRSTSTTSSGTKTASSSRTTITVNGSKRGYAACPFTTTVGTATIPRSAAATGLTPYSYLGCYKDDAGNRAVAGAGYNANARGVDSCGRYCSGLGAAYFAIEYHGECFCGTDLNDVNGCSQDCDLACYDEGNHICGGDFAAQVYALEGTA